MYKIHEKYPDFDGNMIEGDFYFNLTEAEITEMQYGVSGASKSAEISCLYMRENRKE